MDQNLLSVCQCSRFVISNCDANIKWIRIYGVFVNARYFREMAAPHPPEILRIFTIAFLLEVES